MVPYSCIPGMYGLHGGNFRIYRVYGSPGDTDQSILESIFRSFFMETTKKP